MKPDVAEDPDETGESALAPGKSAVGGVVFPEMVLGVAQQHPEAAIFEFDQVAGDLTVTDDEFREGLVNVNTASAADAI